MTCNKCGAELKKNSLFCHKCGEKIPDRKLSDIENNIKQEENVSVDEPADDFDRYFNIEEEPRDPEKKKYYIMAAVAAFAVVFLVCLCNTNFFKRTFYNPVEYYKYVEKKNAVKKIALFGRWYDVIGFGKENGGTIGSENTMNLKLSEEMLDTVAEAMGTGDISYLSDIRMNGRSTVYDGLSSRDINLFMGDYQVIGLNTINDTVNDVLYLRIPELSDDYLGFTTDGIEETIGLIGSVTGSDAEVDTSGMNDYFDKINALPDAVKITRLVNKYTDLAIENIDNIDKSKKEILELGSVEQKCWILTVKLGYNDMKKLAGVLRDELKEDEDVKDIVMSLAEERGLHGDDAWDDFSEGLDALEDIMGYYAGTEMKVYVDNRGRVIARDIQLGEDDTHIRYGRTVKGREFGARFFVNCRGHEVNIEGSGKKAGRNYAGDFTFSADDMDSIGFTLNSFDEKAFEDQKLDIKLSVAVSSITDAFGVKDTSVDLIKDYLAVLSIDSPGATSFNAQLKLADAVSEPVVCSYSYKRTGGSRITLPSNPVQVEAITDMKDYLKEADFERVRGNLTRAGVPDSITGYFDYIEQAVDYIDYIDLFF